MIGGQEAKKKKENESHNQNTSKEPRRKWCATQAAMTAFPAAVEFSSDQSGESLH